MKVLVDGGGRQIRNDFAGSAWNKPLKRPADIEVKTWVIDNQDTDI